MDIEDLKAEITIMITDCFMKVVIDPDATDSIISSCVNNIMYDVQEYGEHERDIGYSDAVADSEYE